MDLSAAADAVLVTHFLFVLFVLGGFILTLAGGLLHWRWVRNRCFRVIHCAAIGFVALESLAGFACPLTLWEDSLRRTGSGAPSFIGRWVAWLLYYPLPEWVFTLIYFAFAGCATLAWHYVRPATAHGAAGAGINAISAGDKAWHVPHNP